MDGNEEIESLKKQLEDLQSKNSTLQVSLDNALSEVAVAGCVKDDLFELQRQRDGLEGEKKTLESLLIEARDEATSIRTRYEHECARIRAVNEQLETENRELKSNANSLGFGGHHNDLAEAGNNLVDKETLSVITDATKSLARRVKSNLGTVSFSKLQQNQPHQEINKSDESTDASPVNNHDPTGIQKAYEDAEVLKAIIVPLEEQIGALKDKLRETDTMLREFEEKQADHLFSAEILGRWLAGKKSFNEALEELEQKGQEVSMNDSEEKSLILTTLLSTRLSLVVKELSDLRSQSDRCVNELERSMKKCADLRSQTAEANGRLLRLQQKQACILRPLFTKKQF